MSVLANSYAPGFWKWHANTILSLQAASKSPPMEDASLKRSSMFSQLFVATLPSPSMLSDPTPYPRIGREDRDDRRGTCARNKQLWSMIIP